MRRFGIMLILIISLSACNLNQSNEQSEEAITESTQQVTATTETPLLTPTNTDAPRLTGTSAPQLAAATITSIPIATATCIVIPTTTTYAVQAGDTLTRIAQTYKTTVESIVQTNCLGSADQIRTGQTLYLPGTGLANVPVTDGIGSSSNGCYNSPYPAAQGIQIGQFWQTSAQNIPVYDSKQQAAISGYLQTGDTIVFEAGPHCVIGRSSRLWQIRSLSTRLTGWVEEYIGGTSGYARGHYAGMLAVEPTTLSAGDVVVISWEVQGRSNIMIYQETAIGTPGGNPIYQTGETQPASGRINLQTPANLKEVTYFILAAPPPANNTQPLDLFAEPVVVNLTCRDAWFTDTLTSLEIPENPFCPDGPARSSNAAYQTFELGFMIWDGESIWVFSERDDMAMRFDDTWTNETFDNTAPAGLITPERGFGKVWHENQTVRDSLGWATAYEISYVLQVQTAKPQDNSTHYVMVLPDNKTVIAVTETQHAVNRVR